MDPTAIYKRCDHCDANHPVNPDFWHRQGGDLVCLTTLIGKSERSQVCERCSHAADHDVKLVSKTHIKVSCSGCGHFIKWLSPKLFVDNSANKLCLSRMRSSGSRKGVHK